MEELEDEPVIPPNEEASVLDYLLCNTDRHEGNYLVNPKTGKLALIDHGLCLPDKSRSADYVLSNFYTGGEVSESMMKRINSTDWGPVVKKMRKYGLNDAADGFMQRVNWLRKNKELPTQGGTDDD